MFLSRFCNSSLKLVRFAHTINNGKFYRVPAQLFSDQKSNYATSTPNAKFIKTPSLEYLIKDFKDRVENKNRLSQPDLELLTNIIVKQKVDNEQALDILRLCAFGRIDKKLSGIVFGIWEKLKKQGNDFQIQHYNYLLQFSRDKSDCQQTQRIFDELVERGLKPNFVSYQCLLKTYCKSGNIEKAIEILDLMDKDSMHINEYTYNNLIECHIICGDIETANATIESMKENGFKLQYTTLDAFLTHYCKTGDCENITKTLEKFKEENFEVLNRDVLKAICGLAANGRAEKIDSLIPYMKPNIEMRRSLQNAITTFVENKQSALLPKIIETSGGDVRARCKYLIEEMVRLSSHPDEINETIKAIEAIGMTIEKNFNIFEPLLECSSEDLIRKLLAHMKTAELEVTQNLFEKLFQLSAKKGVEDVLNVVNLMCGDFNIQPQITFIRDTILPGLNAKENPASAFAKLQTTKIRDRNVTIAIVNNSLNNCDFQTAYDFLVNNNQLFYGSELIKRPLIKAFVTTGDVKNFVSIVRLIYDSYSRFAGYRSQQNEQKEQKEQNATESEEMRKAFVGEVLFAAITHKEHNPKLTTELLQAFVAEGLTITPEEAASIQKRLKESNETVIGGLLTKLSTEVLQLKPIEPRSRTSNVMRKLSSIDLQNIMEVKQAHGHNVAPTQKFLFLAYIREGNVADIEPMLASGKLNLTNADYAKLIELYTRVGNLESALNILNRVCTNNESFKLDVVKVGKLVTLMFDKNHDFNEIDSILLAHRPPTTEHRIFTFEHLLDKLAASGSKQLTVKLFDSLVKHNYIKPLMETTGPLIVACLNSDSYAEAVEQFEKIAAEHKIVPMVMVLLKKLIEKNEIDLLQRVFDIHEGVHGESVALTTLAFAFVESNQGRQAKAIFENENIKNISKSIVRECRSYETHDRIDAAKTLLLATQGVYCNRNVIYETILNIYKKQNKAQEALELWVEATNDGVLPGQRFVKQLSELLTANNMEIPFDLKSKMEKSSKLNQKKATN